MDWPQRSTDARLDLSCVLLAPADTANSFRSGVLSPTSLSCGEPASEPLEHLIRRPSPRSIMGPQAAADADDRPVAPGVKPTRSMHAATATCRAVRFWERRSAPTLPPAQCRAPMAAGDANSTEAQRPGPRQRPLQISKACLGAALATDLHDGSALCVRLQNITSNNHLFRD